MPQPRHADLSPDAHRLALDLAARSMSLRQIADALADAGHVNRDGSPYNPKSVRSMLLRRLARVYPSQTPAPPAETCQDRVIFGDT